MKNKAVLIKRVGIIDGKYLFAILDIYNHTMYQLWATKNYISTNFILEE